MAYQPPKQPGYQPAPPYYPGQQYQPYAHPQPQYAPQPQMSQQSTSNVVVVQAGQPQQVVQHTTYVERDSPNHLLHCVITFFCPWWIFIWLIVCCIYGC